MLGRRNKMGGIDYFSKFMGIIFDICILNKKPLAQVILEIYYIESHDVGPYSMSF